MYREFPAKFWDKTLAEVYFIFVVVWIVNKGQEGGKFGLCTACEYSFRAGGNFACSPKHISAYIQILYISQMDDIDEELCKEKEKTAAADEEIPVIALLQYSKTKALSGDKYRLYLMQNHMRCLKLSQWNVQIIYNECSFVS